MSRARIFGTLWRAFARSIGVAWVSGIVALAGACRDTPTEAPNVAVPQRFNIELVEGQSVPYRRFYFLRGGGQEFLDSAFLKLEIGPKAQLMTNGQTRMADVRYFRDVYADGSFAGSRTDSSTVLLERKGDQLIITRSYQFPFYVKVDTGQFAKGKMVVTVHEWEWLELNLGEPYTLQFVYLYPSTK
ncbi:MAG: hypothetical protein ABJB66_03275 [Gemmatimonadaceae bacterium]